MGYFRATGPAAALARRYGLDVDHADMNHVVGLRFARVQAGQATRVTASYADPTLDVEDIVGLEVDRAKTGRPWAETGLVDYLVRTDRIHAGAASVAAWQAAYRRDPAGTEAAARQLYPLPQVRLMAAALDRADGDVDPDADLDAAIDRLTSPAGRRPQHVAAAARVPQVEASPVRTVYPNAVEELRASHPDLVRAAERGGPPPTMFGTGDMPTTSASGIAVGALYGLPWRARLAAAWEPELARAHALVENYSDELGPWQAAQDFARHPAVLDYVSRVNSWAATSGLAH